MHFRAPLNFSEWARIIFCSVFQLIQMLLLLFFILNIFDVLFNCFAALAYQVDEIFGQLHNWWKLSPSLKRKITTHTVASWNWIFLQWVLATDSWSASLLFIAHPFAQIIMERKELKLGSKLRCYTALFLDISINSGIAKLFWNPYTDLFPFYFEFLLWFFLSIFINSYN